MFSWLKGLADMWGKLTGYDDESSAERKPPSAVKKLMPKLKEIAKAMNGIDGELPILVQHNLELSVRKIGAYYNKESDRVDFLRSDNSLVVYLAEGRKTDGSHGMVAYFLCFPSRTDKALFESTPWLNAEIRPVS